MITRDNLIGKYLKFFKSKKHRIIPSASLVPENDPTVLFTTAGMHPLVPFLLGERHPLGKKLANVQKCIRTTDIDDIGDETHHTFFEMLGNWSLGSYWKKEAIEYSLEFLTKILKIKKEKISVTCFKGDKDAAKDEESASIWRSLGVKKVKFLGKNENWWGPAGEVGPCGPDTEMFINGVEIWNDVFMEYYKNENGQYLKATQRNVDTGMGVERTLAILNKLGDNYLTNVWKPIIKKIEELSHKNYKGNEKLMRIIADHVKASVFILGDGITPSNTGRGYVLRRLIRRAVRLGKELNLSNFVNEVAMPVFNIYPDYPGLQKNKKKILNELSEEESKFNKTLEKGLKMFKNLAQGKKELSGRDSFLLFQSYGFPLEIISELCKEEKIKFNPKNFGKELEKHQELSKTASSGTFKSGLADNTTATTKLHTATHLLNEALRRVLKKSVKQKGSNITSERLRFDFNFPRKLTQEEIKKVEGLVNLQIKKSLDVKKEEMSLKKALESGAQAEFGAKYPEKVFVYSIGDFSREICTGPHVNNTSELGHFKIVKEESSAAGVRRIKAILE